MICDPDVVIRVENLKTRFGDHIIHQDLNLEVHRGEIFLVSSEGPVVENPS